MFKIVECLMPTVIASIDASYPFTVVEDSLGDTTIDKEVFTLVTAENSDPTKCPVTTRIFEGDNIYAGV